MNLSPAARLSQAGRIAGRLFEGRMLLVTPDNGTLHRLNETGTFIWQHIATAPTIETVARAIVEEFSDIDYEGALEHVRQFAAELASRHLLSIDPPSPPSR